MDSDQYEELCRQVVAEHEGLNLNEVKSLRLPNPSLPKLPHYSHQIDLYWETSSGLASYKNIANAKWRRTAKIKQGEMLQLQQVRQEISAHKAFIFTNVGFTRGARAVAEHHGIGLHLGTPAFDPALLPKNDRPQIRAHLSELASTGSASLFAHTIEHRGLDFTGPAPHADGPQRPASAHSAPRLTRVAMPSSSRPTITPERRAGPQHAGRERRG